MSAAKLHYDRQLATGRVLSYCGRKCFCIRIEIKLEVAVLITTNCIAEVSCVQTAMLRIFSYGSECVHSTRLGFRFRLRTRQQTLHNTVARLVGGNILCIDFAYQLPNPSVAQ